MEHWPSHSQSLDPTVTKKPRQRQRGKASVKRTNYPILDHGVHGAASLVPENGKLAWRTTVSHEQGRLHFVGQPVKCYPCTKPRPIHSSARSTSLQQRSSEGIKYLRTAYPDIDIPFSLVKEQLSECDELEKQLEVWDPMQGNKLSVSSMLVGSGRNIMALAHPSGPLDVDLKISPFTVKQGRVIFHPRAEIAWTSDTPICQIESSASDPALSGSKGGYIGVRSYGKVSILDLRTELASLSGDRSPFKLSEVMLVRPSELDIGGAGAISDLSFMTSQLPDVLVATTRGSVFVASCGEEKKIFKVCSRRDETSLSWKVYGHNSPHTGSLVSDKSVYSFDVRDPTACRVLFKMSDEAHLLTSLATTKVEHLSTITSTDQIIWLDSRYAKQPLLGWKHHRGFDRSLRTLCEDFDHTSMSILTSAKNNHATAICVGKLDEGPLQCKMSASALPSPSPEIQMTSSVVIRNPDIADSFRLVQLSDRGSLHQSEFVYGSSSDPQAYQPIQRFHFQWSDDIFKLEKQSLYLENENGGAVSGDDMQALYQELFSDEALAARTSREESEKERLYDILDKLPTYWQRTEHEEGLMKTLLEIVAEMDEEFLREGRSLFLSEDVLESARGFRALAQGRFASALDEISKAAPMHADLRRIMEKIDPAVFHQGSSSDTPGTSNIDAEDELDVIARKLHARNAVDLDLTLASDVFSFEPIKLNESGRRGKPQDAPQDVADVLSEATGNLKLTQSEPPHVVFSFFKPVWQEGRNASGPKGREKAKEKSMDVDSAANEEDEVGEQIAEMPMGVRLLLADWELGSDPQSYQYVDPYGVDDDDSVRPPPRQSQNQYFGPTAGQMDTAAPSIPSRQTQSQVPPVIATSRSQQTQMPPSIGLSRNLTGIQTQTFEPSSQSQTDFSSSQMQIASTQVLPGPFGGRPGQAKKKPPKKRVGGF